MYTWQSYFSLDYKAMFCPCINLKSGFQHSDPRLNLTIIILIMDVITVTSLVISILV